MVKFNIFNGNCYFELRIMVIKIKLISFFWTFLFNKFIIIILNILQIII